MKRNFLVFIGVLCLSSTLYADCNEECREEHKEETVGHCPRCYHGRESLQYEDGNIRENERLDVNAWPAKRDELSDEMIGN